jgi:hypothetical protein
MFKLLSEIMNTFKQIDCTLKIECRYSYVEQPNIPILVFQKGTIRLVIVSIDNYTPIRETLINLNQAVKLLKHQNFFITDFLYKKYMHRVEYAREDFPKFHKDWKKFLKNIKDEVLKNI